MGKEYLVEGAKLMCVQGDRHTFLQIPKGHGYTSGGKKKANCLDCVAGENIQPFGGCAKNKGNHQCEGYMQLVERWESMSASTTAPEKVNGEDALTMDSVLLCRRGGLILPLTSGQGYDKEVDWEVFARRFRKMLPWVVGKTCPASSLEETPSTSTPETTSMKKKT